MEMVSSDRRDGGTSGDKSRDKAGRGVENDLPRAGEMMAGLARQSHTLAVYIGLEDAPDASGERYRGSWMYISCFASRGRVGLV